MLELCTLDLSKASGLPLFSRRRHQLYYETAVMVPPTSDMVSENASPKKTSTLNPDAPLFLPSPKNVKREDVPKELYSEDVKFECPGQDNKPIQPPLSVEDLSDGFAELLDHEHEELLVEWNADLPAEWNVEDFSSEWWELVHTSALFREYWMMEYQIGDGDINEDFYYQEVPPEEEGNYMEPDPFREEEEVAIQAPGIHKPKVEDEPKVEEEPNAKDNVITLRGRAITMAGLGLDQMPKHLQQLKLKKLGLDQQPISPKNQKTCQVSPKVSSYRIQQPR